MTDILFPTDFSSASAAAGRVAREAALQAGAVLHVVHVVPPVTDPFDSAERLAAEAARLGHGISVRTALLHGRPVRRIVEYARTQKIGLIVLGTHGRTGVSHAILGSVAEAVVRLAPCLVLTVPPSVLDARAAAGPAIGESGRGCLICAGATDDQEIVCERCRSRVRAEGRSIGSSRPSGPRAPERFRQPRS